MNVDKSTQTDGISTESRNIARRSFLQGAGITAATLASGTIAHAADTVHAAPQITQGSGEMQLNNEWDKTFAKSDRVSHRKVTFKNRYGLTLAADLYIPVEAGNRRLAALAVSGPFGAVKEQSSGLYAQTMAERGFVTVAFDPSYTGESSGEPRNLASPDINTEDFMAAVDFLGLQPNVDRERIGVIGVCGFGGMALSAVAADKRVKAVVTSTMYDMSRVMARGLGDQLTPDDRTKILAHLSEQRWKDAESGIPAHAGHAISVDASGNVFAAPTVLPESLPANPHPILAEFFDYYRTPRGYHKNSINSNTAFTATMPMSFMNMPLLTYIKEIAPRPVMIVVGDHAHSRYLSEAAYEAANEPKELVIIPNANHVDLYDRADKIPFGRIDAFFKTNLSA